MQKREVGTQILHDYDTGKYYRFNQNNGQTALCDVQGHPVPSFYQDFSGFASTLDRKDEMRIDPVPCLETLENIPKYIGRPAKYVGYQQVPRPGIKMSAASDECAYTIPKYLEPMPPKLGKVSLKVKVDNRRKTLPTKQKQLPSFLQTMESQYAGSLSLSYYLNKTFPGMANTGDVAALKAKNKQTVMSDGIDLMAELRKHRMPTKNKFGAKRPPYTPLEVRRIEKEQDKLVNPRRNKREQEEYLEDKASLEKRRRDRYLQYFVLKDDQEAALNAV